MVIAHNPYFLGHHCTCSIEHEIIAFKCRGTVVLRLKCISTVRDFNLWGLCFNLLAYPHFLFFHDNVLFPVNIVEIRFVIWIRHIVLLWFIIISLASIWCRWFGELHFVIGSEWCSTLNFVNRNVWSIWYIWPLGWQMVMIWDWIKARGIRRVFTLFVGWFRCRIMNWSVINICDVRILLLRCVWFIICKFIGISLYSCLKSFILII